MTNLLIALVTVTLHTNYIPVVTEEHHVEYQHHGSTVRALVSSTVVTNAPVDTNGILRKVHFYTDLTGDPKGKFLRYIEIPPQPPARPKGTNYAKIASKAMPQPPLPMGAIDPMPVITNGWKTNVISSPWSTNDLTPPSGRVLDWTKMLMVASNRPFCTNFFAVKAFLGNYFVADYQNFTDGRTYQLQTSASPLGPWAAKYATFWDGGADSYWRVTLPTSGSQGHPMQFIRFQDVTP